MKEVKYSEGVVTEWLLCFKNLQETISKCELLLLYTTDEQIEVGIRDMEVNLVVAGLMIAVPPFCERSLEFGACSLLKHAVAKQQQVLYAEYIIPSSWSSTLRDIAL